MKEAFRITKRNNISKKKKPLQVLVIRTIIVLSAMLILVFGAIGLLLNSATTLQGYKRETSHNLAFALSILDSDYLYELCNEVKRIYFDEGAGLVESSSSEGYVSQYADLVYDDRFWEAREVLEKGMANANLDSVAIFLPDEEQHRIIFVIDGYDIEQAYMPGEFIDLDGTDSDDLDTIRDIATTDAYMRFGYGKINGWIATNYVEIKDPDGKLLGYAMADVDLNGFVNSMAMNMLLYLAGTALLVFILARVIAVVTKRNVVEPIDSLARSAEEYIRRDKTDDTESEACFDKNFDGFSLELDLLGNSLADMEQDIKETMKRIKEMTAEKERLSAELAVATNIQAGVLRTDFPAFPDRPEFEVTASMTPAKEVGGDLYDFFLIDDDHLCLVIGDVSGKGVPAALFMVVTTTVIRNVARTKERVSEIMRMINEQLCRNNRESLFVTLWLGVYTISEKKLVFASAGHECPLVYRQSEGRFSVYKSKHDIPLGLDEEATYREEIFELQSGDRLLLYTDGVPEATRADKAMYGEERMLACVNRDPSADGAELLSAIETDVKCFIEDAPQFDDITMLYLGVTDGAG